MHKNAIKTSYKSRLPHLTPIGAAFFITFRLNDSLPRSIINEIQQEYEEDIATIKNKGLKNEDNLIRDERKRRFGKYDQQLDTKPYGECYLKNPKAAKIVKDKLHKMDGVYFNLWAYCIMSNHVHLLIDLSAQLDPSNIFEVENPENYTPLHECLRLLKGSTSRGINLLMGRKGSLWQKDSYDHFIRNEKEWNNILRYILNNPVKAGLVENWEDWPHNYMK